MSRASAQLRRIVIFVHRWMGVPFCLLFLLWFLSGIAMMYCDYPMVSRQDQISHSPALDPAAIKLSPEQAYGSLQRRELPQSVRLDTFDGRPVYRFRTGGSESIVYADTGEEQLEFPPEMTLRLAAAWTRQPAQAANAEENNEEDQWTVSGEFSDLRPLRKYTWADGEQVYVSSVTGDVVQYTTRDSRFKAYIGPIPHWLYFTGLRKHGRQWSAVVIWASGLATFAAMLGIVIAVSVISPEKRFRHAGAASSLPYAGWKRWHSILGLMFGILACSWAFSGMLSMDPFPALSEGGPLETAARFANALREKPLPLSEFNAKPPPEALAEVGSNFGATELELISFGGEATYLAYSAANQTRAVPVHGQSSPTLDFDKIVGILHRAAAPAAIAQARVLTKYDRYYLDRHNSLPLPALLVQLNDPQQSSFYIDPGRGRIVKSYNSRTRVNRWLYHGLHSMDLPVLYGHRPAWDIVVLLGLLGGACLCITSLKLAWGVLRRGFK
jgi:hypothetical protein